MNFSCKCKTGMRSVIPMCCIVVSYAAIGPAYAKDFKPTTSFPLAAHKQLEKRAGPKGDLHGSIAANRPLGASDTQTLLSLSEFVIDRKNDWVMREVAMEDLGLLGHQFGIPPLLAVIRDESEKTHVRAHAAGALIRIADKRVVDHLIRLLQDESLHFDIANNISEQLIVLTGRKNRGILLEKGGHVESALEWKVWWKKNRKRVKLDREATMLGAP